MWIGIASARCDFSPPQKGPRTAPLHDNGLKTNFGKNKGKTATLEPRGWGTRIWLEWSNFYHPAGLNREKTFSAGWHER